MSAFSDQGNVTLGQLIEHLESLNPFATVAPAFGAPDSYRGYYEDVAFTPVPSATVGEMLAHAKSALGQTFHGWKGGEYVMNEHTDCWLAERGSSGVPIVASPPDVFILPTP